MFLNAKLFNQDINNWNVNNVEYMFNIFYGTLINNSPKWYKKI